MLRHTTALFFFLLSFNLYACWKISGTFSIDGETKKIHHKFQNSQEFTLPFHDFILTLSLDSTKKESPLLKYLIQEKKKTELLLVSQGEEEMRPGKKTDIFAKGEKGRPHSILTLELVKQ